MIKMIAACSLNGVIGCKGTIPWRLRNDMRFFRRTTVGNTVVMGRKTFESIGRPLPDRRNVVITRNPHFSPEGVVVIHSPEEALQLPPFGDIYVIGGEQVYRAMMPYAKEIFLTRVHTELPGDTFFPPLEGEWKEVVLESHGADAYNEYPHTIYKLSRISS